MTDYANERLEEFVYRTVTFPGYEEGADIGNVVSGSVELAAFNDLKATGAISFKGEMPSPASMVRMIYRMTDANGETSDNVIATMFGYCAKPVFDGVSWGGDMDMKSVLAVAEGRRIDAPLTLPAGTNAAAYASGIISALGIRVAMPSGSEYLLSEAHTFDSDTSFLSVANWLLDKAGYSSCAPDRYGGVVMAPYVEPSKRTPSWTFRDDESSIMVPQLEIERDWDDAKNAVRATYSTAGECLRAWAVDVDPESETSAAMTWERTEVLKVDELNGDTPEERLESLKAIVRQALMEKLSKVEKVKFRHAWVPLMPNDAVEVDYVAAGTSWRGAVTDMAMVFETPFIADLAARRFLAVDAKIEVGGEIVYAGLA